MRTTTLLGMLLATLSLTLALAWVAASPGVVRRSGESLPRALPGSPQRSAPTLPPPPVPATRRLVGTGAATSTANSTTPMWTRRYTRRVAGRLVDAVDGRPHQRAFTLGLFQDRMLVSSATVQEGRFDLQVPLHCDTLDDLTRSQGCSRPDRIEAVTLPPGAVTDLVIPVDAGSLLELEVVDRAGRPVPDAMVLLGQQCRARTDLAGRASLRHLVAGGWTGAGLSVRHADHPPTPVPVKLPAVGRHLGLRRVVLPDGATLTGTVVDRGDRPLGSIQVTVRWSTGAPPGLHEQRGLPAGPRAITDPEGRFSLRGLHGGQLLVELAGKAGRTPDVPTRQVLLHLSVGDRRDVRMAFPETRLTGRLLDRHGDPIAHAPVVLSEQAGWTPWMSGDRRLTCSALTDERGHFTVPSLVPDHEPARLSLQSRQSAFFDRVVAADPQLVIGDTQSLGVLVLPFPRTDVRLLPPTSADRGRASSGHRSGFALGSPVRGR